VLLADHEFIQKLVDFLRLGQVFVVAAGVLFQFLTDDVVTQFDAFIADINARSGNQFPDFMLALPTERTIKDFAICAFQVSITHRINLI
jgi:hypothetical protein